MPGTPRCLSDQFVVETFTDNAIDATVGVTLVVFHDWTKVVRWGWVFLSLL